MRTVETIDSELRLLAAVRRVCREHGGERSSRQMMSCSTPSAPQPGRRGHGSRDVAARPVRILVNREMDQAPRAPRTEGSRRVRQWEKTSSQLLVRAPPRVVEDSGV